MTSVLRPRSTKDAFHSLLVAVDLSPLSDRVVGRAASLPIAAGGTVTLLHVVPKNLPVRALKEAEKRARTALASEARDLSKAVRRDVAVNHTVSVGVPAAEIAAFAARVKADLVVMGRGAGRPLRDAFLGSTAERVIRRGRAPVLVVRLPPRVPYRRPALGLDRDEAAAAVVAMLFRVIPPPRPQVAILHSHDAPYLGLVYARLSEEEIEADEQKYRQTAVARLEEIVARALRTHERGADDLPRFKTYVRYGDPRTVIKAAAKKLDTDLLLLGTHAYSGAAQIFLGTVAGEILRDVRCDVLVVPPRRRAGRRA